MVVVDKKTGREEVKNLVVIDDPLPCTPAPQHFPTLWDYQTEVELRVMQSRERARDKTFDLSLCVPGEPIGQVTLHFERPLPADSRGCPESC